MTTWRQKLEKIFAAVAFAEADDHRTALNIIGAKPAPELSFDRLMAAVTFAEADCPDMAREFLGVKPQQKSLAAVSLDEFMASVGLGGVRACYGVVRV